MRRLETYLPDWCMKVLRRYPLLPVYLVIFLALVLKYFLISDTSVRNAEQFLLTAKFLSSDSFDWIANGVRMFENEQVSYRQPGYWLLIMLLNGTGTYFLHNLILNLTILALIVGVSESIRALKLGNFVAVLVAFVIFANGNIQGFANYALSDMLAISIIALSIMFYIKGWFKTAFFVLGISATIQYFAFILAVPYFLVLMLPRVARTNLKDRSRLLAVVRDGISYIVLTLAASIPWLLLRQISFGSAFYSGVNPFALFLPNFNSLLFYAVHAYTMIGISTLIMLVGFIWGRKRLDRTSFIFLWSLFAATFFFWVIGYEWDDRRFVLYFLPFLYIVLGVGLGVILGGLKPRRSSYIGLLLLALFATYPTFLNYGEPFHMAKVPLYAQKALLFSVVPGQIYEGATIARPIGVEEISSAPFYQNIPIVGQYWYWYNNSLYYKDAPNDQVAYYNYLIDISFAADPDLCISPQYYPVDPYVLNSVLLIRRNVTLTQLNSECVAPPVEISE